MKKKIFVTFIIFFAIIALYNIKSEATFKITDFEINCNVEENGDIEIEENIYYYTNENKNGLIRTINTKNNMNSKNSADDKIVLEAVCADDIEYQKVNSASIGQNGVYTLKKSGTEYEIKVFSPFRTSNKKITYKYKLSNVAVKYNDIAELYWNFIGAEWDCEIDKVKINITLPQKVQSGTIYVYGHGSDNGRFSKIGNYITLTASGLEAYQALDARILFPTSALPQSNKLVNKNVLDKYINQEEGISAKRGKPKVLFGLSINEIALSISTIIVVIGIYIYIKYDKEYKVEKYKYYREIPYNLDPEILQKIYYGKNKNAFLITFLNLIKKGVFRIEKTVNEVGKETEKIVFVEYGVGLKEHQKIVRDLIRSFMKSDENEITLLELQSKMKTHTSSKYRKFRDKLNNEIEGLFGEAKKAPKKIITVLAILMVILIGFISILAAGMSTEGLEASFGIAMFLGMTALIYAIFFATVGNFWPAMIFLIFHCGMFQIGNIGMLISCNIGIMYIPYVLLFILIQYVIRVKKQSKEERQIREQLKGLRRFLNDYSYLAEKEEITEIVLWEEYFILAIALGLNKQVIDEWYEYGQMFMNSNLESSLYNVGGYTYIDTTMRPMFSRYSSMQISSSSGSRSSYSGSSGGFSGGSSSGGGGRRRRRRKFFLSHIIILL